MTKVIRKHELRFDGLFLKDYRPAIFVCTEHSVSAATPPHTHFSAKTENI